VPQGEPGASWWPWTLFVLGSILCLTLLGVLTPDGARSGLLLYVFVRYLDQRFNRSGPWLTKRTRTPSITPFPPHPGGRPRTRRRLYPRHYHLRRKMSRRNPVLTVTMELIPWDNQETKAHMKHRWISNPRATYGTSFDTFCRSLDPLPAKQATDDPLPTTSDQAYYRKTPGDTGKERRADEKHKWISDPWNRMACCSKTSVLHLIPRPHSV
jgi:hypothetical protein